MSVIEQNVRKRILEIVDVENNLISNNSSDVMRNRYSQSFIEIYASD